ncbi:MAG: hypothetical protein IPN93_04675 [Bacteroidetes bacterium]|nr:hypothetical protein [Bacteroidota bacterium]
MISLTSNIPQDFSINGHYELGFEEVEDVLEKTLKGEGKLVLLLTLNIMEKR